MAADTALAVVSGQFSPNQLDIIKNQIAKGASDEDLALFIEVCKMTGLNPFQRQIYAVMRRAKEGEKWVSRMTIQTGIDGYRLVAARTGQLAGIDDPVYDRDDVDNGEHPNRATVTVWRFVNGHRVPFTATARWREYAQEKDEYVKGEKTGKKILGDMWARMPFLMLGKCAEALALRKAFPAELSGVYTGEEMQQADHDMQPPQAYIEAEQTPSPRYDLKPVPTQQHQQPAAKPAATNPLFERWQALQPDEPAMRTVQRYNNRWRQMFSHGAPFSDEERATFAAWLEREEDRHKPATVTEETSPAEAEPIPFDLRTAPITDRGA